VPEFTDLVFAKTSSKRPFSVIENEHFGLVLAKTGSKNSGTGHLRLRYWLSDALTLVED
jgi:hypothetical protein